MPESASRKGAGSTTAIVGVGNIGSALARHLVRGDEAVVLAAKDGSHAEALADELGPLARAASVEDAVAGADAVVFALWLDTIKELLPRLAGLLEDKVVIDPSNPIAFDEKGQTIRTLPHRQSAGSVVAALLPAGAHYVKAFGTLAAGALAAGANREPPVRLERPTRRPRPSARRRRPRATPMSATHTTAPPDDVPVPRRRSAPPSTTSPPNARWSRRLSAGGRIDPCRCSAHRSS
jgi:predicted dinucleotide-binding enzyme